MNLAHTILFIQAFALNCFPQEKELNNSANRQTVFVANTHSLSKYSTEPLSVEQKEIINDFFNFLNQKTAIELIHLQKDEAIQLKLAKLDQIHPMILLDHVFYDVDKEILSNLFFDRAKLNYLIFGMTRTIHKICNLEDVDSNIIYVCKLLNLEEDLIRFLVEKKKYTQILLIFFEKLLFGE